MNPLVVALPALAMASIFGLVLALPRRSPARRIVNDLERRASGGQALTERVVDARDLGRLRARFLEAGWSEAIPSTFLARCVGGAGLGLTAGIALAWLMHPGVIIGSGLVLGFAGAGGYLPYSRLGSAIKRRNSEISRALPDLLDTLASTVRAGLALNAALAHVANAVSGPLSEELHGMLGEIRHGRARTDALRALVERLHNEEITQFVRALIQAERLGANLSTVLTGLSTESRERRVLKAEEKAAALPVKMVLPMALFVLPALFVMIFGAVAADYYAR
ncbi:MAG TPA: type II secretion system F family protein [Candidatus Elarobacter sp.]|jgi:tight adherence protein C|nr:type II secretion system F family protein [Candidatus Elarobacter sp.]